MSATDVPVRIRHVIVQVEVECSTVRTIVRVTDKRKPNPYRLIIPLLITQRHLTVSLQPSLLRKWFQRRSAPEVPARIRHATVQVEAERPTARTSARVTAKQCICRCTCINPIVVTHMRAVACSTTGRNHRRCADICTLCRCGYDRGKAELYAG